MEKEFVKYETALALKELGFDEPCFGYWNIDPQIKTPYFNMVKPFEHDWCLPAPLYQQAFRFFREKYMLLHEIVFYRENKRTKKGYWYVIDKWNKEFTKREIIGTTVYFETYEEAESTCLDKLIEIVKTNEQ